MIRIIKEYLKKFYKEVVQQGLIISTFHGSYTVSKEHDRATAAGNHETSDEIMPATKLPHRFPVKQLCQLIILVLLGAIINRP